MGCDDRERLLLTAYECPILPYGRPSGVNCPWFSRG